MAQPNGQNRKGGRKTGDTPEAAKKRFLTYLQDGKLIKDAIVACDRSLATYENWRRNDPRFAAAVDRIRLGPKAPGSVKAEFMPFPAWSHQYMDAQVFGHTQNVVDLLNGDDPSWLHPAMTFERGEKDLVLVNMPPEHAKTMGITINMSVHEIAMDPNARIIIVSKSQAMARKMLYAIKTRLTHPKYEDFQHAYGPQGGYDYNSEAWNADKIYISDDIRDSGEKDPTVEALGIGSHVYGARADLIILDDCVDLSNAHMFDQQIDWIQAELLSRLSHRGRMLIVGTRLSSRDLYSEIRDPKRYPDEVSPWTYLAMPAVLDFAEDPDQWVCLWPRSNQPEAGDRSAVADEDGLFPKWDGKRLLKKRGRMSPRSWAMVYQQQQSSDTTVFAVEDVKGCMNGARLTGMIPHNMNACREGKGMEGLITVAGLDPATSGFTAAVAMALDPHTHQRYVLDVYNKAGTSSDEMRDLIKGWIVKYKLTEFRIEKNAFQGFLSSDREINQFASANNCVIRPHFTGVNKHDPDFGVAAMAGQFKGWESKSNMIELPGSQHSEAMKALVEQLVTWFPGMNKKLKTDTVMALWFATLAVNERDTWGAFRQSHIKTAMTSPRDITKRRVINIDEYLAEYKQAEGF
jgi:hypothetical protein